MMSPRHLLHNLFDEGNYTAMSTDCLWSQISEALPLFDPSCSINGDGKKERQSLEEAVEGSGTIKIHV